MKKLISLLVVAALVLSMFTLTAFAGDEQPTRTEGPAMSVFMYGGARAGIYSPTTERNTNVVGYDYDTGKVEVHNDAIAGMTYDMATNTLTVNDVHKKADQLYIWYMGDDFKLNVVGENEFGVIYVYNNFNFHSVSLNIVGTGTLTVNEELLNPRAIQMYADGNPLMSLDIADSVTVNLYSQKKGSDDDEAEYYSTVYAEDEEYYPVIGLSATAITPAEGGAITVGGKTAAEVKNKQIVRKDSDYVNVVRIESPDRDYEHGYQVKSKADPDGIYALIIMDGVLYIVSRYIYLEDLGVWTYDRSYTDKGFIGKQYDKEGFEAEYDYVDGMAPAPIDYMSEYLYNYRGSDAIKVTKDGEDAVYIGLPTGGLWDWDGDYRGNYQIKRVVWDDNQQMYVEDASFEPIDLMANELEENGYHLATETVDKNLMLTVWTSADPDDDDRFDIYAPVMVCKSDPDGLYVQQGRYGHSDDGGDDVGYEGILVRKVHYNPETEEHYIEYDSIWDEDETYLVSYASLDDGTADFYYDTETVEQAVQIRYLQAGYKLEWDLSTAIEIKKNDEPDEVYAYRHWTHINEDDTQQEEYGVMHLIYDEKLGCYHEDEDYDMIEFNDPSELEGLGFTVQECVQHLEYYTKGNLYISEYPAYTDNDGNTYCADYNDRVYSYDKNDGVDFFGETCYFVTREPEISVADLNDTEHDVVTDNYSYWISGPEYHHVGGDAPAGSTVSGTVTCGGEESEAITVKLAKDGKVAYQTSVTGTLVTKTAIEAAYSIEGVANGTYTMTVSKKNHIDREYEVVVSGDTVKDAKIHLLGDIDGDGAVSTYDFALANSHAKGVTAITDPYIIAAGNIDGEGDITTFDAAMINSHAKGVNNLW